VWRSLLSNEPLLDEFELERGKEPSDEEFLERYRQFGERRRQFRTGFDALVGDASRCLKNLPFDWNERVAKEAVNSGSDQRWLYCLFDVAWGSSSGLLDAKQQFYFEPGNVVVPYEPGAYDHLREWVRRHGGEVEGRTGNTVPPALPVEWDGRLPECYFSILRDFYGQSVAFVDWLLAVERTTRDAAVAATGNRNKRRAKTLSVADDAGAGLPKQGKRAKGKKIGHLKNSEELFKSALRQHHGYETGGSVSTYDYATTYRIAELVDQRISASTAGRQFNEHFGNERKNGKGKTGGIDAYRHSCIAKTIGTKLMALFGDFMKTFGSLGDSQDGLSVEDDHEDDSDDEGDSPKRRGGQRGKVARKF